MIVQSLWKIRYERKTVMTRIVIIGSSAAGISAAEAARKQDPNAEIRVFSQDTFLPYYRLRIGEVITDPAKRDSLTLHPASWYEDRRIELNLNQTVTGVDVKNKTIALADDIILCRYTTFYVIK